MARSDKLLVLPPGFENVDDYQIDPKLAKELAGQILESGHGKIRKSHLRLRQLALDLAAVFDKLQRIGMPADVPEGSRFCQISDTLARKMAATLRAAARADD